MFNRGDNDFSESLLFFSKSIEYPEVIKLRPSLEYLYLEIDNKIARTDSSVLLTGDSGVGKEIIAELIHQHSYRKEKPLICMDLNNVPELLLDTELFGHEKGAFTGAYNRNIGKIELANGGTLFLDEICEMPLNAQSKLLRVLQERRFRRIGGKEEIKSDFRLICATNKDIVSEVKKGKFRSDLYYRINVIPIYIPSLSETPEDVPHLLQHYLNLFCKKYGRDYIEYEGSLRRKLETYQWPGNVRELVNICERIATMYDGRELNIDQIFEMGKMNRYIPAKAKIVIDALVSSSGNVRKASLIIGCTPITVHRKIKKYNLRNLLKEIRNKS